MKKEKIDSTLYPGQEREVWLVKYNSDGVTEHFEEEELRSGSDGPAPATSRRSGRSARGPSALGSAECALRRLAE